MTRLRAVLLALAVVAGLPGTAAEPALPPATVLPSVRWVYLGTFTVRAYCKCKKCCGKWAKYHTTTGGVDVGTWKPVVAVDPAVIPLGTQLWVDGVGARVASDTGPNCKGRRMEILMPGPGKVAHQRAVRFGVKRLKVYRAQEGSDE